MNPEHIAILRRDEQEHYQNLDIDKEQLLSQVFQDRIFENCSFVESDLRGCKFLNCFFVRCNFREANLSGCEFFSLFHLCDLQELNIESTKFVGSTLIECTIGSAKANKNTDLRGVMESDSKPGIWSIDTWQFDERRVGRRIEKIPQIPLANYERSDDGYEKESYAIPWSKQTRTDVSELVSLILNHSDAEEPTEDSENYMYRLIGNYHYQLFKDIPIGTQPRPMYRHVKDAIRLDSILVRGSSYGYSLQLVNEQTFTLPGESPEEKQERIARAFWSLIQADEAEALKKPLPIFPFFEPPEPVEPPKPVVSPPATSSTSTSRAWTEEDREPWKRLWEEIQNDKKLQEP